MEMFKWLPGRQSGAEYKKLCFLNFRVGRYGFDGYILRYPKSMHLRTHTDPVEGGKMWRLNITLWGRSVTIIWLPKGLALCTGIVWFRPDIHAHGVTTTTKTCKLSLGFVKFNK